jgi:hypothetical protein
VLALRKRIVRPADEWPPDSAAIKTTSLGHSKSELSIREWDFYTALMKTKLAYSLPRDIPEDRAYGAYLQYRGLLKWLPNNLRITQSGVFSRKDSARTALSGRFGEALMYLYMVKSGYPYWDHLPSLAERLMETLKYSRKDKLKTAKVLSRPKRKDGKSVPEPDFVFEDPAKNVRLVEAKGPLISENSEARSVRWAQAGKALAKAHYSGNLPPEMAGDTVGNAQFPDWFSGSIMPDGTLNAILHLDDAQVSSTRRFFDWDRLGVTAKS